MKFLTPKKVKALSNEEMYALAKSNQKGTPDQNLSRKLAKFRNKPLIMFCYVNWKSGKENVHYLDHPEYYDKIKDRNPMDERNVTEELKLAYLELAKLYDEHFNLNMDFKHSEKENVNKLLNYEKKAMLYIFSN